MGTDEGFNVVDHESLEQTSPRIPILLISDRLDGDWHYLYGTINKPKDGRIVSLGRMFERDHSLTEVADLPEGWEAYRQARGANWRREKGQEG